MFERYTEKARRAIFFARYEASQYGSPCIESEHLLLGLLREDKTLTRTHIESIRKEIQSQIRIRERISTSVEVPLSHSGGGRLYGESLTTALTATLFSRQNAKMQGANGLSRWQLRRAMEYLEAHITQNISLEEMAKLAGLSQSQFARSFKVGSRRPDQTRTGTSVTRQGIHCLYRAPNRFR